MGPQRGLVLRAHHNDDRRNPDGPNPVSYPHLDVYKRQVSRSVGFGQFLAAYIKIFYCTGINAYAHLTKVG